MLPKFIDDRNRHCRTCGGMGFASTLEHAFLIGLLDNKGMYEICQEEDFPCHTFQCDFAGLYCQKQTKEKHKEKMHVDPKGGKGTTWIRYVNTAKEGLPDEARGKGVELSRPNKSVDERFNNSAVGPTNSYEYHKQTTAAERERQERLQKLTRGYNTSSSKRSSKGAGKGGKCNGQRSGGRSYSPSHHRQYGNTHAWRKFGNTD